jgi:hypothetical protein
MAAEFFGVARAGHFELGLEARAHQGVERLVLDLHAVGPPYPLPQRLIRGKALGAVESSLQAREHGRGQGDGFTQGNIGRQQGLQAPSSVQG